MRKYFGVGWGFLCLGLVGHHFWTLGQFSLGGKSACHCVWKCGPWTASGETFTGEQCVGTCAVVTNWLQCVWGYCPAWLHQVEGREKGFRPPHTIASLCMWPNEPSGGILAQGNDGFVFSPPWVVCGRRRKGEAESERPGTADGPGSHWGWTGRGLLSLVPICHLRPIPSSSDPPAPPWLRSWGLGRSKGQLDPHRWFWGAEWNRAEILAASVYYSPDLFKITGFIWLLNQKGCDTFRLFTANSKSAALFPGLHVIFPTCTSSVFSSLGRYVNWNNKGRCDCGYTRGLARTLCPVH